MERLTPGSRTRTSARESRCGAGAILSEYASPTRSRAARMTRSISSTTSGPLTATVNDCLPPKTPRSRSWTRNQLLRSGGRLWLTTAPRYGEGLRDVRGNHRSVARLWVPPRIALCRDEVVPADGQRSKRPPLSAYTFDARARPACGAYRPIIDLYQMHHVDRRTPWDEI